MEQQLTDLEYSNTDATVEQVKAAIRAAKEQPDGTSFSKNSVYFRRERCLPP